MPLRDDILQAAETRGINPYSDAFKPSELGLKASDYGSFSDYCADTRSAQWNTQIILRVVEYRRDGKPFRYVLLR